MLTTPCYDRYLNGAELRVLFNTMTHVVQKKVGYEKTVAVGQMDQVTQGVAANAEQNASVSVELSNQASLLGNTIHDLQQLISIHDSSSAATEPMNLKKHHAPASLQKNHSNRVAGSSGPDSEVRITSRKNSAPLRP